MRVLQILSENINSAEELKSAFNDTQWANIICYFISQYRDDQTGTILSSGLRFFIGDDTINSGELANAQRIIGKEMGSGNSPGSWQASAIRYGMGVPNASQGLTWDTIYNHLAPHKDTPCELEVRSPASNPGVSNDQLLDTPETRQEFIRLIQANTTEVPDPLTTEENLIDFFRNSMQAIQGTPSRTQPDDQGHNFRWFVDNTANEGNPLKNNWIRIFNSSKEKITNGESISKAEVIELVWQWLISADSVIATARRTPRQSTN